MEEIEPPTEHLHEQVNEGAEHGRQSWMVWFRYQQQCWLCWPL